MLSRRSFLLWAVAGGATLAGLRYFVPQDFRTPQLATTFLRPADRDILIALIPVFLDGALSIESLLRAREIEAVIMRFDASCQLFYPRTRDELRALFDALQQHTGTLVLTGTIASVTELSYAQKSAVLNAWRESFLMLFNTAYTGMHNLIMASFYGDEAHWALLDYRGPPVVREYPE